MSGASDTSLPFRPEQDMTPIVKEWAEISSLQSENSNPAVMLDKVRRDCTTLLVQCFVLQIRYGCDNDNCTTTTCFSYKKRFTNAPIRRPTPLTARNEAFELAAFDDPFAYLCPYALRTAPDNDNRVDTAAVRCFIKEELAASRLKTTNNDGQAETRQRLITGSGASVPIDNDVECIPPKVLESDGLELDYSRQLQVDKSSLRQVLFNMKAVRDVFSPPAITSSTDKTDSIVRRANPIAITTQASVEQQHSCHSSDEVEVIVVTTFTFQSIAMLAALARDAVSRGMPPLSPFISRSLSYNLSSPAQLLSNVEYLKLIEYPLLFHLISPNSRDTIGQSMSPLRVAAFDVMSFRAWQPYPDALALILNNLWHCLDAVFIPPPEIASKTNDGASPSHQQYLDDSEAARLLYVAIVALVGTKKSGPHELLADALACRNCYSAGNPPIDDSTYSRKLYNAYYEVSTIFEFEPALRLAKKVVNAFGIRRSFWYAMRSVRGEDTTDDEQRFPIMSLVTANMHWYLRSRTPYWNINHVPQMYMHDFLDAMGMSPGSIFMEWVKTVFRITWDGRTVLSRWSGAGAALEIMNDLWDGRNLSFWRLQAPNDFKMLNVAPLDQLKDHKVSSEYSHWAVKYPRDGTFHKNNRHIFHYPFIFSDFQRTTYFRAILYEQMYAAHSSARMTRNLHSQFATLLSPRLSDYQCSIQNCDHAVCERQRSMRRQSQRWQAAGYTNDDQFPGSFWNRGVYLSHKLRKAEAKYLVLNVRRDHLLEDAFDQLWGREQRELQKPLKVRMGMDGEGEEGVDHGGVAQEFFRLVLAKAFDPAYGLFVVTDDNANMNWFRPLSPEPLQTFELIGLLVGLAVFNGITLPLNFPQALYMHLCGADRNGASIYDGWPGINKSLRELMDWNIEENGSIEDVFALDYAYAIDTIDGQKYTINLKASDFPSGLEATWPGPRDPIPSDWTDTTREMENVCYSNRADYTNRFVQMMLFVSVSPQLAAFTKGFRHLILEDWTRFLLTPTLKRLVEGWRTIDLAELRQVTRYENDYTLASPIIQWFWEVVLQYDQAKAKKLLTFVTASDRVPSQGWRGVRFSITRNGGDAERLPTSSTCFGKLLLPEYESKEKLERLLGRAIEEDAGFGNF